MVLFYLLWLNSLIDVNKGRMCFAGSIKVVENLRIVDEKFVLLSI